jgi:hypothetical protein
VIERARHEVDVGGIGHVERGEPREHFARIRAATARALRLAGRAGRVDGRRAEHLASGQCNRLGRARAGEIVERQRPVATLRADRDPRPHCGGARPDGVGHRQEPLADEHDRGLRVVEDVRDLVRGQAVVHRDGDGAHGPHARRRDQHLEAVVRIDDRVLSRLDAEPDECVTEPVARVAVLGPRHLSVSFDQRGALGLPLGMLGDGVHAAIVAEDVARLRALLA